MRAGKVIFVQIFIEMKELITRFPYNPPVSKEFTTLPEYNFVASIQEGASHDSYDSEDLFA